MSVHHMYWFAGLSGVVLLLGSMKVLFGSFSVPTILREWSQNQTVDKTYKRMFQSRENYCYHISSARARGDTEEAKRMAKELVSLDKQIGEFEKKHYGRSAR